MHYSEDERKQLEELSQRLMDGESLRHTERMIVDSVIHNCERKGEDLSERLQVFMSQGLTSPH